VGFKPIKGSKPSTQGFEMKPYSKKSSFLLALLALIGILTPVYVGCSKLHPYVDAAGVFMDTVDPPSQNNVEIIVPVTTLVVTNAPSR